MKIIEQKGEILTIELAQEESEIITRVIDVPVSAFGSDAFVKATNIPLTEMSRLKEKFAAGNASHGTVDITVSDLQILVTGFKEACTIIDEHEMHTLTGFTWEQASTIKQDLISLLPVK